MEGPMDTEEASIPTEEPERMRRTSKRKAAKRTCFTLFLPAANILLPPPEEDIPARKKPRLQASLPVIGAADADTLNASKDDAIVAVAVAVASPDAGGTDPVADSPLQPNTRATRAPFRWWTPEEDTALTSAVKNTCKKKYGAIYRIDWIAVAVLVPGKTKTQCLDRWNAVMSFKSDLETRRTGKWTKEERVMLKAAVEKHNGKDWTAISALVPGRTEKQCSRSWYDSLDPTSDETTVRKGKWTKEEDVKLKDAVKKHNGKDWAAISALVSGRVKHQCWHRWVQYLDPGRKNILESKSDETTARVGKWTTDEDNTLKAAVEKHNDGKHNGKNWEEIVALVPGRTKKQCNYRWHDVLVSMSDGTTARKGKWTKEEDVKLKDAVQKHNGKDWVAISKLVPGRTKQQCQNRWHDVSISNSKKNAEKSGRNGKWTSDEDSTLKDAIKKYNGENWAAISALVPGRTKKQCWNRCRATSDSKKNQTTARMGTWTKEEVCTLKDAVKKHNGEDWAAISALVPGRTEKQCWHRWHDQLRSKTDETTARAGKWTTDEDSTLKEAVEKHNGENWAAIAALVPGRTKMQCRSRWQYKLFPNGDATTARKGKWLPNEDSTLKDVAEASSKRKR